MTKDIQNKILNNQESSPSPYQSSNEDYYPISEMNVKLAMHGLRRQAILGDGNCLFRALSYQLEGHQGCHLDIRKDVCNYLEKFALYFMPYICEPDQYENYLDEMRTPGTYGGQAELVAFANLYNCVIHIVHDNATKPIIIEPANVSEVYGDDSLPTPKPATTLWLIYYSKVLHYESTRSIESSTAATNKCNSGDSVEPLSTCAQSDSGSDYNPDCKYSKQALKLNVCKVIQRTKCQDKKRIMSLLLENENQLKKVLRIFRAEENAQLIAEYQAFAEASSPSYSPSAQAPAYPALLSDSNIEDSNPIVECEDNVLIIPDYSPLAQVPTYPALLRDSNVKDSNPIVECGYSVPSSPNYYSLSKVNSPVTFTSDQNLNFGQDKSLESAALIELLDTSDVNPSKLHSASFMEVSSSSVSLKSSRREEDNENLVLPKKAKNNTTLIAKTSSTVLAALIEPSCTSDIISSTPKPTSLIVPISSSIFLKSPHRNEEKNEQTSSKKLKSNNQDKLTEPEPFSTNISTNS